MFAHYIIAVLQQFNEGWRVTSLLSVWTGPANSEEEALGAAIAAATKKNPGYNIAGHVITKNPLSPCQTPPTAHA
jgi:hypothetical protein